MQKAYEAQQWEDRVRARWAEAEIARPPKDESLPPFAMAMPPPNVTGVLHAGHAMTIAVEDSMIRLARARGEAALWVPGTDHAAIATESVVLKKLGIKNRDAEISREDFLRHCQDWTRETHAKITSQITSLGASADFCREAFTMDPARNRAVEAVFAMLAEKDLLVRAPRLVNWSCGARSVLSDDELEWEERQESFCTIACGEFAIGTVRSETKCADSPVVVHPTATYVRARHSGSGSVHIFSKNLLENSKELARAFSCLPAEGEWKILDEMTGNDLAGKKFTAQTFAGERAFFVLADEVIDPNKGTGAMTISAMHSADDHDLAMRHDLEKYCVEKITPEGLMTELAGPLQGETVEAARTKAIGLMRKNGLLLGEDQSYKHRVPVCYRSGCVVEPRVSTQLFIAVEKPFFDDHRQEQTTLKQMMISSVEQGEVQIVPKRFEKTYFSWANNLRDWCISRQIWWGHRIPAWYDEDGTMHTPTLARAFLARHGQSEGNAQGIMTGSCESPLTELGKQQAAELGRQMAEKGITRILVSPLPRARQTAEIARQHMGAAAADIPIETVEDLHEIDVADELIGKSIADILEGQPDSWERCFAGVSKHPNTETFQQLLARAQRVHHIIREHMQRGDRPLVISHGFFLAGLRAAREGIDTAEDFDKLLRRWSCHNASAEEITEVFPPPNAQHMRRDQDTLDTWFSSATWPFSVFGWPDQTPDLQRFFPTQMMETGYDIIFFWVARMVMFSRFATGKSPFQTVFFHGLVRDGKGRKMSKSLGNGIDPLEISQQFGTDALRLALLSGTSPGNDARISTEKIAAFRNAGNKVWNIARFIVERHPSPVPEAPPPSCLTVRFVYSRLAHMLSAVDSHLAQHRYGAAVDAILEFAWSDLADFALEACKAADTPQLRQTLRWTLGVLLRALHPFAPFVTEAVWMEIGEPDLLANAAFPAVSEVPNCPPAGRQLREALTRLRALRDEAGIPPAALLDATVWGETAEIQSGKDILQKLARLSALTISNSPPPADQTGLKDMAGQTALHLHLPAEAAHAATQKRQQERAKLQTMLEGAEKRLQNAAFISSAPPEVVAGAQQNAKALRDRLRVLGWEDAEK